jgi:hypothetical protein
MRKAIIALAILASMTSVAQAQSEPKIKVDGSLAVRFDNVDVAKAPSTNTEKAAAEVIFTAKINDEAKAVIGLATGDAKSRFTTLGDGNNANKSVGVDLAYVDYAPLKSTKITLGKMYQPWASTPSLFLDKDIHPEGAAVAFNPGQGFTAKVYQLKTAQLVGKSDSSVKGFQVGFAHKFNGINAGLNAGMMNHDYATSTALRTKFDLKTLNAFAGAELAGKAVTLFGDYAKNDRASVNNEAKAIGVTFGRAMAKNPGSWDFSVLHQSVQANALPALWVDSEFAGGNAQNSGNAFVAKYVVAKNLKVEATYYDAKFGPTQTANKHLMVDLKAVF